jgi:hypothetical protein
MQQLGAENMWNIKNLAKTLANTADDLKTADDDVPELVENFDEASKNETTTLPAAAAAATEAVAENTQ